MTDRSTFRIHRGSVLPCLALHVGGWTVLGLSLGLVDFLHIGRAIGIGIVAGLVHGLVQWVSTSVMIERGVITTRNFIWVRQVPVEEIQTVLRIRRRAWSGVSVRLFDGSEIVLAAPTSSVLSPNPEFAEDLGRLCAAIALSGDLASPR